MTGRGRYELTEHTADVGIRGRGEDLPALFEALARGMFAVVVDPATVERRRTRTVRVDAEALPDLLHDWLEALNTLHQVEHEVYGGFRVELAGTAVTARVEGEPIDPSRHALRTEVKAVTWHGLRLEETGGGWLAEVLLDI